MEEVVGDGGRWGRGHRGRRGGGHRSSSRSCGRRFQVRRELHGHRRCSSHRLVQSSLSAEHMLIRRRHQRQGMDIGLRLRVHPIRRKAHGRASRRGGRRSRRRSGHGARERIARLLDLRLDLLLFGTLTWSTRRVRLIGLHVTLIAITANNETVITSNICTCVRVWWRQSPRKCKHGKRTGHPQHDLRTASSLQQKSCATSHRAAHQPCRMANLGARV